MTETTRAQGTRMIGIVLAAGLGTNFIIVALLFRRERRLSRQLSDMRAERNSEWILHALRDVPEERERAAPAAGGDSPPHAAGGKPIRRKKHLGLYLGGGSAAVATALWRTFVGMWQRSPALAGAAGIVTVLAAAAVLTGAHCMGRSHVAPPSPTSTVAPTTAASRAPRESPSAAPDSRPPTKSTPATSVPPRPSGGLPLPTPPSALGAAATVPGSPFLPAPSAVLGGGASAVLGGQLLPTPPAVPGPAASSGLALPPAPSAPQPAEPPAAEPLPAFTARHARR